MYWLSKYIGVLGVHVEPTGLCRADILPRHFPDFDDPKTFGCPFYMTVFVTAQSLRGVHFMRYGNYQRDLVLHPTIFWGQKVRPQAIGIQQGALAKEPVPLRYLRCGKLWNRNPSGVDHKFMLPMAVLTTSVARIWVVSLPRRGPHPTNTHLLPISPDVHPS